MKAHPDTVYEQLKADAHGHSRTLRNLEIIHTVCKSASETDHDYTPTAIGRKSEQEGGPKINTLHSTFGRKFRILIDTWRDWDAKSRQIRAEGKSTVSSSDAKVLQGIPDPLLRSWVGAHLAELRDARRELTTLKANTVLQIDMRPTLATGTIQVVDAIAELRETEREALKFLAEGTWLSRLGLKAGPRGEATDKEGNQVIPLGTMVALRKLIGKQ